MCTFPDQHHCDDPRNGCCLSRTCDWHGPHMLQGPGHNRFDFSFGNGHCPECGFGKHVNQSVIIDPFLLAAQRAANL